jgi:hypothetical protein
MSTGTGLFLVAVGGVLLPAAARGRPRPDRLRRWINPSGIDDPTVHSAQSAAEADVRQIREDDRLFDPHGPGMQRDEL